MRFHPAYVGSIVLVLALTGARQAVRDGDPMLGACALVTQQEGATALGAPVPAGTEKAMKLPMGTRTIAAQYCFYGSEVVVARMELGSGAADVFGQYRQSLVSQSGYADVSGLGDEAFAAKGQLTVRKGETLLIIDVGQARGGGAKELQAEKTLALLALGRL